MPTPPDEPTRWLHAAAAGWTPANEPGNTALKGEIRAITLDLDDTLWPIEPVIDIAERRLHDWLCVHCPRITRTHTVESMREIRLLVAELDRTIAHDVTEIRRRSLERLIVDEGAYPRDMVDLAMAEFLEHRNRVELFTDTMPFLRRASASLPLLSISNGNADLRRVGLSQLFRAHISASDIGAAKPDSRLFQAACDYLALPPRQVLHIGDHPIQDILGAARTGMKTVWINRTGANWEEEHSPDYVVTSLEQVPELVPLDSPGDPE